MTDNETDRRPLASRSTAWAQSLSQLLARSGITPNQISFGSMVAAALSLGALYCTATATTTTTMAVTLCLLIAAVGCQLRLVCNLMDGMVAIEAGKKTADGAVWNELPDRVADCLILVGVGLAAGMPALGWAAAALAVSTAYVRELGKGIDGVVDFTGPMAKPHRMALVTGALLLAALITALSDSTGIDSLSIQILRVCLWVVCGGCLLTVFRRTQHLLKRLH